jgi:hypothetical protein
MIDSMYFCFSSQLIAHPRISCNSRPDKRESNANEKFEEKKKDNFTKEYLATLKQSFLKNGIKNRTGDFFPFSYLEAIGKYVGFDREISVITW